LELPYRAEVDLVGHRNIKITETVYRHLLRPEIRDGAEHMNEIFTSKSA
jgi:integrase